MDMVEYAIHSLGQQARGIADLVPNPSAAKDLLRDAAELLTTAAGERHSARSNGEMSLDDDTADAQREQLTVVEKHIGAAIHREPLPSPRWPSPPEDRSLSALTDEDLFAIWGNVMRTLKDRGVVRSTNRPLVGDYAETLAAAALAAERPGGPDRGVDLVRGETRYQVKARLDPAGGTATHFDIANLDEDRFDIFVGIVFGEDFQARGAWTVDRDVLVTLASPAGAKHRVKIKAIEKSFAEGHPGVHPLEL